MAALVGQARAFVAAAKSKNTFEQAGESLYRMGAGSGDRLGSTV
jgi:hypothetical protein